MSEPALSDLTKPNSASPGTGSGQRTLARAIWQAVVVGIIMFSSLGCYLVVLKWRGPDARFVTYTSWDDIIPFQPGWVWVYLIPYIIGPVAIGILRPVTFRWYVTRGLTTVAVTLLIFIAIPTQTASRPTPNLGDGPTAALYQNMIAIDEPPANAAPSLHVSLTLLLALALWQDFPQWWLLFGSCVALVWLATLFTRQHHLIDVGTAILLTALIVYAWGRGTRMWGPGPAPPP
jgi:hypothetical protein